MIDLNKFPCEHPKLIVNRKAVNYIAYGFPFWLFGVRKIKTFCFDESYIRWDKLNEALYSVYNPETGEIDIYNANSCYVDLPDGNREDLFMLVKCGNCLSCAYSRVRRYSHRLALESESFDYPPLFITLTYRNAPEVPLVRDCQLFIKRLRENVRKKYSDVRLRYFLVAETGSLRGRVHYHLLLYGMPHDLTDNNQALECYQLIAESWQFDRRKFRKFKNDYDFFRPPSASRFTLQHQNSIGLVEIKPTDGRSALFNYVGKYMFKKDLFHISSSGLGLRNLDYNSLRKSFLHCPTDSLPLLSHDGSLKRLSLDSTILNKIAPSYGRLFDAVFRRKFQNAGSVLRELAKYGPSFQLRDYQKRLFFYKNFFNKNGLKLQLDFNIYKYGNKKLKDCIKYVPRGLGDNQYVTLHDDTILNCFSYLEDILYLCKKKEDFINSLHYGINQLFDARERFFESMKTKSKVNYLLNAKKSFAQIKNSVIFAN